uniref:Evasin n=1 Tax=Rhipicephalus appendiculatus TaxID=34631 RepID=A0A131Z7C3_RHIAP
MRKVTAAGFLLWHILIIASNVTSGYRLGNPINHCKRLFLHTKAGPIGVGCLFYCTTTEGSAKVGKGHTCVNTNLQAYEKMLPSATYICTLGICTSNHTCEPSGLSIECSKKKQH